MNISTALYPENSLNGLMLCGINWGGEPQKPSAVEEASFFSDKSVNDYRYRNRLMHWFALLGHPLISQKGIEGIFERSIVQTNWLPGQAQNMRGADLVTICADNAASFICHVERFRPTLIMLVGFKLFLALNRPAILKQVEGLLGNAGEACVLKKSIEVSGHKLKSFSLGIQSFEKADVVAFPHPTGSIGLSDKYIESFKDEIGPIMSRYLDNLIARLSL